MPSQAELVTFAPHLRTIAAKASGLAVGRLPYDHERTCMRMLAARMNYVSQHADEYKVVHTHEGLNITKTTGEVSLRINNVINDKGEELITFSLPELSQGSSIGIRLRVHRDQNSSLEVVERYRRSRHEDPRGDRRRTVTVRARTENGNLVFPLLQPAIEFVTSTKNDQPTQ